MRVPTKCIMSLAVLLGALVVFVSPASAAPGAVFNSFDRVGCNIFVDVTFEDAGTYALNNWDDGNFLGGQEVVTTQAGERRVLTITLLAPILQGAAGMGISIADAIGADSTQNFANNGSYDFPGSAEIGAACEASGGVDSGETPVVDIVTTTPFVAEGTSGNYTITRSFPGYALDVDLVYGGVAIPGVDTSVLPTTVTIPEGATSVNLPVPALLDGIGEMNEPLVATIVENKGGYILGQQTSATLVIIDPPAVTRPPGESIPSTTAPSTTSTPSTSSIPTTSTTPGTVPSTTRPGGATAPADTRNCTEIGRVDILRGDPLYRPDLDRDNDGVACEAAVAAAARPIAASPGYAG